ncbi:MAG: hypothetical protein RLO17_11030 [Cyclobacteriaceae bacterium]
MDWNDSLKKYKAIVEMAGVELKGKTVPYTSDNGHMFSQLNKDGEIGIRLSNEEGKAFMEKYMADQFMSYGAKMRGYVKIPEDLMDQTELVSKYMKSGHRFVLSLEPK